jgi:hypothetical protein
VSRAAGSDVAAKALEKVERRGMWRDSESEERMSRRGDKVASAG